MQIVIIEDEQFTAEDLAETILKAEPAAEITAILRSVKEAREYFGRNPAPSLIFSDIQLGDGLSFELFKSMEIAAPVIFCTAYNEYALTAFKAKGIDYILKPFTLKTITEALNSYRLLKRTFSGKTPEYEAIIDLFGSRQKQKKESLLVYYRDKILPVRIEDIALFYLENDSTHLTTFNRKTYLINKNLEELELLAGADYFRANRQCLLNRKAVKDVSRYFSRKLAVNLVVPFNETITVSKTKVPEFLNWLAQ